MIIKGQISFLKSVLYLAAVIQSGTITKAAERNGIKATNLSRIIKDLEETIGVPLLIRKSNGVLPTQAALLLYEKAIKLENDLKLVQMMKKRIGDRRRFVRLYLSCGLSLAFLKEFVRAKIKFVDSAQDFHVAVFNEEPAKIPEGYQVGEYDLNFNGLSQKLWIVCQSDNQDACSLADFITSKLFPSSVPLTPEFLERLLIDEDK